MAEVRIYHNPACGTSCNVLGLIRNSGIEAEIVEYLKTPPTCAELANLIRRMNMPVRDLLRRTVHPTTSWASTNPRLRTISPSTPCWRTPS